MRYSLSMAEESKMVAVFRSADHSAEAEAAAIRDMLEEVGVSAELVGDDSPGVPVGAYEVRVRPEDSTRAEALIAASQEAEAQPGDISHDLDLETVFASDAHNAEMQALSIRGMLEANGIPAVIVGASVYPNLPVDLRVPRAQLEEARRLIQEAESAHFAETEDSSEGQV